MNMTRPMDGRDQDRDEDRSRNVTRPTGGRDEDREGDRAMMRRPPMLCSELVCGSEDVEKCQEFKLGNGRPQRALCIPLGKCKHLAVEHGWNFNSASWVFENVFDASMFSPSQGVGLIGGRVWLGACNHIKAFSPDPFPHQSKKKGYLRCVRSIDMYLPLGEQGVCVN